VAQLRRNENRFKAAAAKVVLVGMGTVEESAAFKSRFNVPFPLISDPDARLYRAFGLERLAPAGFFSASMLAKGVAAMAGGHLVGKPVGDVRQLPGVFVIDGTGAIRCSHSGAGPEDHPGPEEILSCLPPSPP
jgi:peroxiredoxin